MVIGEPTFPTNNGQEKEASKKQDVEGQAFESNVAHEKDQPIEEVRKYKEYVKRFIRPIEQTAEKSGGFLYFPEDNIYIGRTSGPGMFIGVAGVVFTEPEIKEGIDDAKLFEEYKKNFPAGLLDEAQEDYRMTKLFEEVRHPRFGGPVEIVNARLYESMDGISFSVKLGENGELTLPGTAMVRGRHFPKSNELIKAVRREESDNLEKLKKENRDEIISGSPRLRKSGTGINFVDKREKPAEGFFGTVCHNPENGIIQILTLDKTLLFRRTDALETKINLKHGETGIHAIVSYDQFKETEEGGSLPIQKLYFNNKAIASLEELPDNVRHLFEFREGIFYVREMKQSSELKLFGMRHKDTIGSVTGREPRQEINIYKGWLFEQMVGEILGVKKNNEHFPIPMPKTDSPEEQAKFEELLKDMPEGFREWAMKVNKLRGKSLVVKPDFILTEPGGEKIFIEAKTTDDDARENRLQRYRMKLFQLLSEKPVKIKYYFYRVGTESNFDREFPDIKYENIHDHHAEQIDQMKYEKEWNYWTKRQWEAEY